MRLPSLLDPKPFERNLDRWIDWDAVHRNVDDDVVEIVGTVATAARSGRTVVFVEGHAERIKHKSHAIDYVTTRLDDQHVRASAAIPILFPPVRVEHPSEARGWYFDGGTRLNTPIKPALDLGAERLIVIATDSVAEPSKRPGRHDSEPPDFGDGALHVLQGMLVDPVVEDMRILGNINMFFADRDERRHGARGTPPAAGRRDQPTERYRAARGKPPYRCIPYIFIAPEKRGAIGRLASEVFRDRYGGLKGLRSPDFPLLNRLLGGESPTHGELLSYLFFDREFIEELIRMGQRDARRWLRVGPGPQDPWQIEPLDAFTRKSPAGARRQRERPTARRGGVARIRRRALSSPFPGGRACARASWMTDCSVRRRPSSRSTSAAKSSSSRERVGSSALRCTSPARAGANWGSNVRPFSRPSSSPSMPSCSTRSSTETSWPRPTL